MARPPRDPRILARDVDLAIKMREIREWSRLREDLAPRFGELFLLAGLFSFALGLILTLVFALPQEKEAVYFIWLLWGCGFILMLLVVMEFLIRKFRVLRRVVEIQARRIDSLEKRTERLARAVIEAHRDSEQNSEEPKP